jgi:hypothetical protein
MISRQWMYRFHPLAMYIANEICDTLYHLTFSFFVIEFRFLLK